MNANENKYQYNSKELIDEAGLDWYHYGARYYDPQLGRWHSVDPVDQYYSPYLYVQNNPICFVDKEGFWGIAFSGEIDAVNFSVKLSFAMEFGNNDKFQIATLYTEGHPKKVGTRNAGGMLGASANASLMLGSNRIEDWLGEAHEFDADVGAYSGSISSNFNGIVQGEIGKGPGFGAGLQTTKTRLIRGINADLMYKSFISQFDQSMQTLMTKGYFPNISLNPDDYEIIPEGDVFINPNDVKVMIVEDPDTGEYLINYGAFGQ